MADRDAILHELTIRKDERDICYERSDVQDAMDEYMKATCLELLEYMAKNNIHCTVGIEGNAKFDYKGEYLTKEEIFENFL